MTDKIEKGRSLVSKLTSGTSVVPSKAGQKTGVMGLFGASKAPIALKAETVPVAQWKPLSDTRLAFVIDATASRNEAWAEAITIQARMLQETREYGELLTRLVHFKGQMVDVFPKNEWALSTGVVADYMSGIQCQTGHTRIVQALQTCLAMEKTPKAIVAIGDCCEEDLGAITAIAKQLGERKIPVFAFQEGDDASGEAAYKILAEQSGGVFSKFGKKLDLSSLMVAAAVYSTGGMTALSKLAQRPDQGGQAARLVHQQLLRLTKG